MMYVIGLGNPGLEYEKNRHNTGRILLEQIAKDLDFSDWKKNPKINALVSSGTIEDKKFSFVLPETFMNNSGVCVSKIIDEPKKTKDLVVVYDDLDLPFGKIKISYKKSSGGHNGLSSIIKKVRSEEFVRIRIGVSFEDTNGNARKPKGEDAVLKFLLGDFKKEELQVLRKISKNISEILYCISKEGREIAMTKYN